MKRHNEISPNSPIGIFDSGLGALSILRSLRQLLPNEDLILFADQAHVPYGSRHETEVQRFSLAITDFLLARGAKLIVVACNTASAAALDLLREQFPEIPFVGMEPAVKPGAASTSNGRIGILATSGTFGSERYASLIGRFAEGVVAFEDPCLGLVEQIESGQVDSVEIRRILKASLEPMIENGIDTVVLGCTHYPLVSGVISDIAGPDVTVIDPSPAVARQVRRVLLANNIVSERNSPGSIEAFSSGDAERLSDGFRRLLDLEVEAKAARWSDSMKISDDS